MKASFRSGRAGSNRRPWGYESLEDCAPLYTSQKSIKTMARGLKDDLCGVGFDSNAAVFYPHLGSTQMRIDAQELVEG